MVERIVVGNVYMTVLLVFFCVSVPISVLKLLEYRKDYPFDLRGQVKWLICWFVSWPILGALEWFMRRRLYK